MNMKSELKNRLIKVLIENGFNLHAETGGDNANLKKGYWALDVDLPNGFRSTIYYYPKEEKFVASFLEKNRKKNEFLEVHSSVAPRVETQIAEEILEEIKSASRLPDSPAKDYIVTLTGYDPDTHSEVKFPWIGWKLSEFLEALLKHV